MDPILVIFVGITVVLLSIILLRLHAVIALLLAALLTGLLTSEQHIFEFALNKGLSESEAHLMSIQNIGKRLSLAFGNTAGKIGILIALASIIGTALMRSGGAERIIRGLLSLIGKKNASLAFLTSSFVLAIPVFFDTVFYLLIPLVKSMGIKNPQKFSLYLMAIIAGSVMAHSLIPPTPGPLFVANELGIDLGLMMMGGIIIGSITAGSGYLYALWANLKWDLPMRSTEDISLEELETIADREQTELPSLWFSCLPIAVPILLIMGNTILNNAFDLNNLSPFQGKLIQIFSSIGDPNIALFIASFFALLLLWTKLKDIKLFKSYIGESLLSAGLIILITSAGGAFGQMLQQTNIGNRLAGLAGNYQMALLPLAFFLTALVRTAQGSATVAMITTIGIMAGFMGSEELAFHPVYLALIIGCGSKVIPWMNDSGFWIISKMSGMNEKECMRHYALLLGIMGFTGMFAVLFFAFLFPMV